MTSAEQQQATDKSCVVDAAQTISCSENPVQAVRSKPGSSIVRGIRMVKEGAAAAFVSAGNTGAVLASSFFTAGENTRNRAAGDLCGHSHRRRR